MHEHLCSLIPESFCASCRDRNLSGQTTHATRPHLHENKLVNQVNFRQREGNSYSGNTFRHSPAHPNPCQHLPRLHEFHLRQRTAFYTALAPRHMQAFPRLCLANCCASNSPTPASACDMCMRPTLPSVKVMELSSVFMETLLGKQLPCRASPPLGE